jgi:ABC-type nitrate/sulfonate/bicarbonate transport system substrate-binding protein
VIGRHGVDPKDVQYLAAGSTPAQMEQLRQGTAVAATISPPWPIAARRDGYRELSNIGQEIEYPFGLVGTTTTRLAEDPGEVKALLHATLETQRLIRTDPDAAIAWIARRFGVDQAVAAESYALELQVQNDDGEVLRDAVATYFRIQSEQPELRDVRYEDVVDARPLQEVWRELGLR